MSVAVNILQECTVTMQFSQTDLGGGETFGGAITFKIDKIAVKESIQSSDHSTAQDQVTFERMDKESWQLDFDTKFYSATLLAALRSNALGQVTVSSRIGMGVYAPAGLITDIDVEYSNPSTMKWTLKSRGIALQYL